MERRGFLRLSARTGIAGYGSIDRRTARTARHALFDSTPCMLQSRSSAALIALSLLAAAPAAAAQEPFEPGLRWVRPAPLADAWIPTSVGFSADDQLCWSVAGGNTPRVDVESSASRGYSQPLFEDQLQGPLAGALHVSTCSARNGLFVLQQTYALNPAQRDTRISRYNPLSAAAGSDFAPEWTLDITIGTNGPARLVTDANGEFGFVLLWRDTPQELIVCRVDLALGTLLDHSVHAASSLDSVALSEDGTRLAVAGGTTLRVFDEFGAIIDQHGLFAATPALAINADGTQLVVGGIGGVRVLSEEANGYQERLLIAGSPTELAKVVDLSDDGSVIAIGWWDYSTGVDARFEILDGVTGNRLRELHFDGTPGGLQNSPSALEVSSDGQRIACGAWGAGDDDPEVVLVDLNQVAPVLEVNLPGSVLHLDLDESGTRVLVAAKHLHANQMGITGELRMYDTGERDLQLLEAPRPGGKLHIAARVEGASAAWFLIGREHPAPFEGGLALRRNGLRVIAAPVQDGVTELSIPLPAGNRVLGLTPTIQAAWRVPGSLRFSETLVRPYFL